MRFYNEEGWRDNVSTFLSQNAVGITEPAYEDMGNGIYAHAFTDGEALTINHHVDHDVKPNGKTHIHIHWSPSADMVAGEIITWSIKYVKPKGHHQGDIFDGTTTTLNLQYTADGTEVKGEHMVLEDATGINTPEPDTMFKSTITYGHGTYGKKVYGHTMDLHYEVDRNATPQKAPDFYTAP